MNFFKYQLTKKSYNASVIFLASRFLKQFIISLKFVFAMGQFILSVRRIARIFANPGRGTSDLSKEISVK